ncbi:actin-like isoform X2 [Narcine bancroftii]|uniref:actin-like isoform X2 n=1 Tax=Narcine bancroftii TaxID=1343680 RepID=UPI0038310864
MGCASSVKTTRVASPPLTAGDAPPRETFVSGDRLAPTVRPSTSSGLKTDEETGEVFRQSRPRLTRQSADPGRNDLNNSVAVEDFSGIHKMALEEEQCALEEIASVAVVLEQSVSKVTVAIQENGRDPTQSETTTTPDSEQHNLMRPCEGDLLMRHKDDSFSRVNDTWSFSSDLSPPVVIDNGSGLIKAGLSGSHSPAFIFPSVVGRRKNTTVNVFGSSERDTYVGEEAQRKRNILHLIYPIRHGLITHWTEMEVLWRHTFENELRIDIQNHPIVMTEPINNPQKNKEKTTEILFEEFQVPSLLLGIQAVLALHSTGKVTGTVIDSGSAVTHVVPIFEGGALNNITQCAYLGGEDLTEHMMRSLAENNSWSFTSKAGVDIIRNIKEKFCYVALDFEKELHNFMNNPNEMKEVYELPDGQNMIITNQKFSCPEILFKPFLIGKDVQNLPALAHSVIEHCNEEIRNEMYTNIVLAGGNTMFRNMGERIQQEITNLVKPEKKILSVKGAGQSGNSLPYSRQKLKNFMYVTFKMQYYMTIMEPLPLPVEIMP